MSLVFQARITGVYDEDSAPVVPFIPLQDNQIRFSLQPIALVVRRQLRAGTICGIARTGRIRPRRSRHRYECRARAVVPAKPNEPAARPEAAWRRDKALANAAAQVDVEYQVPAEHHNRWIVRDAPSGKKDGR